MTTVQTNVPPTTRIPHPSAPLPGIMDIQGRLHFKCPGQVCNRIFGHLNDCSDKVGRHRGPGRGKRR